MKGITLKNWTILLFGFMLIGTFSCSSDDDDVQPIGEKTVWNGANITFEKTEGSNPSDAANQDRITDNVWLTRGNSGGQIYNAKEENSSDKEDSPTGTRWAIGTLDNVDNLSFKPFRDAVGNPKNVVGKNLVLQLTKDNIFLSVKFTKWSQGKAGGFAYERSTE